MVDVPSPTKPTTGPRDRLRVAVKPWQHRQRRSRGGAADSNGGPRLRTHPYPGAVLRCRADHPWRAPSCWSDRTDPPPSALGGPGNVDRSSHARTSTRMARARLAEVRRADRSGRLRSISWTRAAPWAAAMIEGRTSRGLRRGNRASTSSVSSDPRPGPADVESAPTDLRPVAPRQRTEIRSTTNTRVSSGPIARPAPRLPYASIGGIVIRRRPPTLIPVTP